MTEPVTIETLLDIMVRLRDPQHGCPWDQQQDFRTIAPYTLEEAYEVVDAIDRDDMDDLQDELGDLLFQVVYHAQMAREAGRFDFSHVLNSICDKMVRRHPHVFADAAIADVAEQTRAWESHKDRERKDSTRSELDGVPLALPALTRACKLQKMASRVGFDWPDIRGVVEKVEEELQELCAEVGEAADPAATAEEAGDLLFAVVNLVRHAGIDPETALHQANRKFSRRFQRVETRCRETGCSVSGTDLETLDGYWQQVKREE